MEREDVVRKIMILISIILIEIVITPFLLIGLLNLLSSDINMAVKYSNSYIIPAINILLFLIISGIFYIRNYKFIGVALFASSILISITEFKMLLPLIWL